jgi:hypothetical protein
MGDRTLTPAFMFEVMASDHATAVHQALMWIRDDEGRRFPANSAFVIRVGPSVSDAATVKQEDDKSY